ncbi:MAG: 4-hydroxythreonine-4-phosphate dehydrogenase PdxA, partial [Shinella sp.]
MTMTNMPPLALTMGDPAGIGPDITLALWSNRHALSLPPFLYIGDARVLRERAALLGLDIAVANATPEEATRLFPDALPVMACDCREPVTPGRPDSRNAAAITGAIETAVNLTLAGRTAAIVTNPIAKAVLYDAGFSFPGHTEFLADLAAKATGKAALPVMLLAGPKLRSVPVTIHIPLKDVPTALTQELIVETATITERD